MKGGGEKSNQLQLFGQLQDGGSHIQVVQALKEGLLFTPFSYYYQSVVAQSESNRDN
jgi:hypothetical protein